jgi:hypothetical protein
VRSVVNAVVALLVFGSVGYGASGILPLLFGSNDSSKARLDPYNAFMGAPGNDVLSDEDPKLEQQQVISKCTVAGRPAEYGWFTYSSLVDPAAPARGRSVSSKLYIIARVMPDGDSVARGWRGEELKEVLEREWTEDWGCRL